MQIDVTDLFDELFSVATIAYTRYSFPAKGEFSDFEDWDAFCANLSDSYFLGLVSNRVWSLIHQSIPAQELKRRIIIHHEIGIDGKRGVNLSYAFPLFHRSQDKPCLFAGNVSLVGQVQTYAFLSRPKHSLKLHLGKLPKPEVELEHPTYDPKSSANKLYFCKHGLQTMFSGTVAMFYELHDGWILREFTLGDRPVQRIPPSPYPVSDEEELVPIKRELFEELWNLAEGSDIASGSNSQSNS